MKHVRNVLGTPSRLVVLLIALSGFGVLLTIPSGSDAYRQGWRGVVSFCSGIALLWIIARPRNFFYGEAVKRTAIRRLGLSVAVTPEPVYVPQPVADTWDKFDAIAAAYAAHRTSQEPDDALQSALADTLTVSEYESLRSFFNGDFASVTRETADQFWTALGDACEAIVEASQ